MPQLDTQKLLDLVERAVPPQLATWDLETSGLGADYQRIVLASVKPFGLPPITFVGDKWNKDRALSKKIRDELEKYTVLVAHNGLCFDIPYLNTRLLRWGQHPLDSRHHLDTYQVLKPKLRTSSKSLAALSSFLKLEQQKMNLEPDVWDRAASDDKEALALLKQRCEADCIGLEQLYLKTRHLIRDLKCR